MNIPQDKKYDVVIIGGGFSGLSTAVVLAERGISVAVFEKDEKPGGHLSRWHHLFPHGQEASELLGELYSKVKHLDIPVFTGRKITGIRLLSGVNMLMDGDEVLAYAMAVVLAAGFRLFDAQRKEEYGYGLYPSVLTAAEVEAVFRKERPWPFDSSCEQPRIAFVHCVGSRDLKCGVAHCSKLCCITAVKQAITVKQAFPKSQVWCFYMDLRMHGLEYEELYRRAQVEYGVRFIRGRLSEASPGQGGTLHVKAEDTLLGKPIRMQLDMLVLMAGMVPAVDLQLSIGKIVLEEPSFGSGFISVTGYPLSVQVAGHPGIYAVGTCKGPAVLPEVMADACAVAREVENYVKSIKEPQYVQA